MRPEMASKKAQLAAGVAAASNESGERHQMAVSEARKGENQSRIEIENESTAKESETRQNRRGGTRDGGRGVIAARGAAKWRHKMLAACGQHAAGRQTPAQLRRRRTRSKKRVVWRRKIARHHRGNRAAAALRVWQRGAASGGVVLAARQHLAATSWHNQLAAAYGIKAAAAAA